MSFKKVSELSEAQIESDVSSYLGYITPFWSKRFRLSKVEEQDKGADKLFNRFVPIYLQFKVSQGLDPKVNILKQYLNYPLAKIVSFRKKNNLDSDLILYFKLRDLAEHATELQHNILKKFNNPPNEYALYVAPLTLSATEYEDCLNTNWYHRLFPPHPYRFEDVEVYDNTLRRNFQLGANPFLRAHISIPPHKIADSNNHHYSYSKNGSGIVWHGGELLSSDFRLSSQLQIIFNDIYKRDNFGLNIREYVSVINDFYYIDNRELYRPDQNPDESFEVLFQRVKEFSKHIKIKYGISLMFLSNVG